MTFVIHSSSLIFWSSKFCHRLFRHRYIVVGSCLFLVSKGLGTTFFPKNRGAGPLESGGEGQKHGQSDNASRETEKHSASYFLSYFARRRETVTWATRLTLSLACSFSFFFSFAFSFAFSFSLILFPLLVLYRTLPHLVCVFACLADSLYFQLKGNGTNEEMNRCLSRDDQCDSLCGTTLYLKRDGDGTKERLKRERKRECATSAKCA